MPINYLGLFGTCSLQLCKYLWQNSACTKISLFLGIQHQGLLWVCWRHWQPFQWSPPLFGCCWVYFEENPVPFFSKYVCSLWNWCSADSVGFSINPRRDQHFALKSLSSNRGWIKGNVCTISLQIKSLTWRITLERWGGKIIPDFAFELARQSCPSL